MSCEPKWHAMLHVDSMAHELRSGVAIVALDRLPGLERLELVLENTGPRRERIEARGHRERQVDREPVREGGTRSVGWIT